MDTLSLIKQPIETELGDFIDLFNHALDHEDGLLRTVLNHIKQRAGKRMRPILILLMAKNFGKVSEATQHAAVGLELLHTASLVHDDVVDEAAARRGQASVNADYDNKVAVLVGDYVLSTALLHVSYTHSEIIVRYLAELGRTLSDGEILQLWNIQNKEITEEVYYKIIERKTAALFESCAAIGADDIFDYYDSEAEIGKPTGNDMAEGKLTLPIIYALNSTKNEEMLALAHKVKAHEVTREDIDKLVEFAKVSGGIEYAERRMWDFHAEAQTFLDTYVKDESIRSALQTYLDYVIKRKK